MGMGIAKGAIFRESRDKCARVMTIPGVNVAAYDFGGFHSRNLTSAACGVERELGVPARLALGFKESRAAEAC
jgi:hypothetical protein